MLKFLAQRLAQGLAVLLVVSALTFCLLSAAGGDALSGLREDPQVSAATLENLRRQYGLDQPLPARYAKWLAGAARGRLGESFYFHAPVSQVLWLRVGKTALLAGLALALALALAFSVGVLSVWRPRRWLDRFCEAVILLASSTPRIVLALLVLAWATRLGWFAVGAEARGLGVLRQMFWPALVLAAPLAAVFLAQAREGLTKALNEDFVRVARAKGLPERTVIFRHALRAALNPLLTIFGYSLGHLMSGSVIVETTLGWPGLGFLSVEAARSRDVPLLLGVVLVAAALVLAGNLLADLLLRFNDPRLRQT
jgi:peptide/nickel transport system permease protein